MKKYKFLEHTADVKFQAFGNTLEEVFKNAVYALTNTITKDKVKSKIKENISMHLEGVDKEGLLYDFLEEFLFLFETKDFILSKITKLKIQEKSGAYFITCEMIGDYAKNYNLDTHIKAVTYNNMFVKKEKNKYVVQVVVDV